MENAVKLTVSVNIIFFCFTDIVLTVWDPSAHNANLRECKLSRFPFPPNNAFKSNGKCYYGWKKKMEYAEAKIVCESGNTHLIFIETEEELQALCQVIPQRYIRVWLGMEKQYTNDDYNYEWLWTGNGISKSIIDYRWEDDSSEEEHWENYDRAVTYNICGPETWEMTVSDRKYRIICEEEINSDTAHSSTVRQTESPYTSSYTISTQQPNSTETNRNMTNYSHESQQSSKDDIIIAVIFIVVFVALLILVGALFLWNKLRKNPSVFENNLNVNNITGQRVQQNTATRNNSRNPSTDRTVAPTVIQGDSYDRLQTSTRVESNVYRQLPQLPPTIPEYLHLVGDKENGNTKERQRYNNLNYTTVSYKSENIYLRANGFSPCSQNNESKLSASGPRTSSMNHISASDIKIHEKYDRQRMPSFDTSDDYLPQYQNDSLNQDFDTLNTTEVSTTDFISDYDSADSYYKSPTRPVSCSSHTNCPDENVYEYIEDVEKQTQNDEIEPPTK